ncbi:phosphoserine phosphatase (serB) [Pyrococcus sp. NA2]|uniref:HAD-IB family phosphatase n=1 Tax=Pyrococcus sp. (strain NA2) TaxID=342949 RepID=UPI000209AA64|nr:HAD-IB family phosphatase [Pyrococcus sp. NA2]AEC51389.1 phosphoserine phosphatase (serB) [Pyrococcus sp. NA2]
MRLIAFDLEGTLTDMVSWRMLHEKFGTCEEAKRNSERFFSGEISYEEWARLDASLWRGRKREEVEEVFRKVELKDYAFELFEWLRKSKFKTAIISGGLMCLAGKVAKMLNADYVYANELVFDEGGRITGDVIVRVTFDNKGEILAKLKRRLKPELTVAVGDWKNDLPMFRVADISISIGNDHADYRAENLMDVKKILESILRSENL